MEDVQSKLSWELNLADDLEETSAPDPRSLRLMREELDPKGLFL